MKYVVCVVRDSAADVFGVPYFVQSKGAAVRAFIDEINRPADNNTLFNHPEDFALFELGTYNDEDATFDCVSHGRQLITGKDAKKE